MVREFASRTPPLELGSLFFGCSDPPAGILQTMRGTWCFISTIIASLAPLLAMCVWIYSYHYEDRVERDTGAPGGITWWMTSIAGRLELEWCFDPSPVQADQGFSSYHYQIHPDTDTDFDLRRVRVIAGFALSHSNLDHGAGLVPTIMLVVPYWAVAAVALVIAIVTFRRWKSLRGKPPAANQHLCTNCGYDLRASKDRCPECGTPIPAVH